MKSNPIIFWSLALLLGFQSGCNYEETAVITPTLYPITADSPLQKYVQEFSKRAVANDIGLPPALSKALDGEIRCVDHDTNCGLWLVTTYRGPHWRDGQRVYFFAEQTGNVKRVIPLDERRMDGPKLLVDSDCKQPCILAIFPDESFANHELWKYSIETDKMDRVCMAYQTLVSPDHSNVIIVKFGGSTSHYKHYFWHRDTGKIEPLISMFELDEGSGRGWDYRWSEDSKAFNIRGVYRDPSKTKNFGRTEADYIYFLPENKIFSVKEKMP